MDISWLVALAKEVTLGALGSKKKRREEEAEAGGSAGLTAEESTVEQRGWEARRKPGHDGYSSANSSDTEASVLKSYTLKKGVSFSTHM